MTSTIIVRTNHIDPEKIRKYHRKRLEQLSLKSIGEITQLDELTEEQKQWVNRRMQDSATSWETRDQ